MTITQFAIGSRRAIAEQTMKRTTEEQAQRSLAQTWKASRGAALARRRTTASSG